MNLVPLADRREVRATFEKLRILMTRGLPAYDRTLGFPGGNEPARVQWRADGQMWVHYSRTMAPNRYWCCYGMENPAKQRVLSITVEVNPPKRGFDRRIRGAFLKDENGRVYIAHSGGVGGGRKGIGREAFTDFYRGATWGSVSWPDGHKSGMILLGCLNDRSLPLQIAHYVHEVDRFKRSVAEGRPTRDTGERPRAFNPEFEGARRPYRFQGSMFSTCDHGRVVNQLALELTERKIRHANDGSRDLFTLDGHGTIGILFEVKTATATSDIYTGVGQLMFHGATQTRIPRLILVVPERPDASTRGVLEKLGIRVLVYGEQGKTIRFEGLSRLIS